MTAKGPIIYLKFPRARPTGWNDKFETGTWTKDKEEILIRNVLPLVSVQVAQETGKRLVHVKYDWKTLSRDLGMSIGSIQKKTMELYYLQLPQEKDTLPRPSQGTVGQLGDHTGVKLNAEDVRRPIKPPIEPTRPLRKMSGVYVSGERQTSTRQQPLETSLVESLSSMDSYGGEPVDATSRFLHRSLLIPTAPRTYHSEDEIEEEDENEGLEDLELTGGSDTGVSSLSQSALENELLNQM